MTVFPVGHQIYNQENILETLNLVYFIEFFEIVLACFFISLETIYGTNIFGAIARERNWRHIFPEILIIFTSFKRWT